MIDGGQTGGCPIFMPFYGQRKEKSMDKITDLVTGEAVLQWLIIFLLLAYFVYKEYPEFKNRMTGGTKKELEEESREKRMEERLARAKGRIADIEGKLRRDYRNLEELLKDEQEDKRILQASLEEREITMRALLAIIDGLHG